MEKTKVFEFQGKQVEFDLTKINMMVNATEMAKIYDKRIDVFLKTEPTKAFIEVLKFPPVGVNLIPMKDEEIMISKGRSGTWMCRILALKFAAWLDPTFEVWVYLTIEKILGNRREKIKEKAKIGVEKEKLFNELMEENEKFRLWKNLGEKEKEVDKEMNKNTKKQYQIFFDELSNN